MVAGYPAARADDAVRGIFGRPALALACPAHPVRGLCGVAAAIPAGGGAREAALVLEAAVGGGACQPGTAYGSAAPGGTHLPWCEGIFGAVESTGRKTQRTEPPGERDPVHDVAGRVPDVARSLYGTR